MNKPWRADGHESFFLMNIPLKLFLTTTFPICATHKFLRDESCFDRHIDQMIRFDAFKSPWFRSVLYKELRRQNFDLYNTFPLTHPTEWLAMLFSGQHSQNASLQFNASDTEVSALQDFIYDLNTELTGEELRGLWSIFTNTSKYLYFVQSVNELFMRSTNWSDPQHENYSTYKHYYELHKYIETDETIQSILNPDFTNYRDLFDSTVFIDHSDL
jgi:hypothetical protein